MIIEELAKTIDKSQLYEFYIIQNHTFPEVMEEFNIHSRWHLKELVKYFQFPKKSYADRGKNSSKTQKSSWNAKSSKEKTDWKNRCKQVELNLPDDTKKKKAEKYNIWRYLPPDEERERINLSRSNKCKIALSDEDKIADGNKKSLKTFQDKYQRKCRTLSEQKLYDALLKIFPDVIYDTRVDDRYPYYCDFYVPSNDLFIELQAHPSHGRLPYDLLSFEEYSKYPTKWVDVFARRDVEKYQTALKNKINLIRIYPFATLQENIELNNMFDKEIIQHMYRSQYK